MADAKTLMALSSLDGRYALETLELTPYFSEFAFIKYRVRIEIQYLLSLSAWGIIRSLTKKETTMLLALEKSFSLQDAECIKKFEKETHHDVKAIEYFLKEKLEDSTCADLLPFVHFGLTSEDVNNIAYALMLRDAHKNSMLPQLMHLIDHLGKTSHHYADALMVGRTHGQVAVPTTFGKELSVYVHRLKKMEQTLQDFKFDAKLNGAVGNYNALVFAFPKVNWFRFSKMFISSFNLIPNLVTTQILPSDTLVSYGLHLLQINTVLVGLSQDMWQYISLEVVQQKKEKNEVGSSTMPQKINPIDFENAEGNALIANSFFELYARKLPISRMQRDLSDSTVKRTMGSALGHTLLSWKSLERGLKKISFDRHVSLQEVNEHWEMLAEAMQIYFKLHGEEKGYEKVKQLLQGKQIDKKAFQDLVKKFPALAKLTPAAYSGLAQKLSSLTRTPV
jgi:adenylosuccinate lyase